MSNESNEITLSSTPALNPALVLREEEDGAILYDPDTGEVRILNPTAVAVCKLLDGRRTMAKVIDALGETYEDLDEDAGEQVLALTRDLYRIGALGTMTEIG
jgi:hypothetical protein